MGEGSGEGEDKSRVGGLSSTRVRMKVAREGLEGVFVLGVLTDEDIEAEDAESGDELGREEDIEGVGIGDDAGELESSDLLSSLPSCPLLVCDPNLLLAAIH